MSLKATPDLHAFLSTSIADAADPGGDADLARAYAASVPGDRLERVLSQARRMLDGGTLSLEELGSEANRWFADDEEARAWLAGIVSALAEAAGGATESSSSVVVKDSNGTVLQEGDSVTVIKDLKVKGGSSDLKRGTMIRKIHLIGDPENIECRVEGSTLVLKTMFLKKA